MKKIVIGIKGISCEHCKMTVERELKSLDGVINVKVDLKKANATVEYDDAKLTLENIKEKINKIGYEVK